VIQAREIKLVPLSEIKLNPKNRNKHPPEQIDRLVEIIKYQGFRRPGTISNRSGFLACGEGRYLAAKRLGLEAMPIMFQDYESEEQEYADGIADNTIDKWAELDLSSIYEDVSAFENLNTDMLGFKEFEMPTIVEPGAGDDEIPEQVEAKTKLGDLYKLGEHRLLCGDSTDIVQVEKLMGGEKADLWIADPPFGVSYIEKNAAVHGGYVANNVGKEIKSDTKTVEELKPFWRSAAHCAYEVTTMEASNYWCACQGSDKMMMMMDEVGWNIRHELIWVKSSFVFGRSDYHYRHEPIIYGWKKKGKHNWHGDRKQSSVFEIDRPSKSDLHPTTKPVALFEEFVKNSTKENDKVYESFGGSGTTLIASEKLNRRSFTMELDPKYCDVIVARWEKYTGKKAVLT